jgi:hypothetical protein
MKVWINRDKIGPAKEVYIHSKEPKYLGSGVFFRDYIIATLSAEDFKGVFKFTPHRGSCKEYEISLRDIGEKK